MAMFHWIEQWYELLSNSNFDIPVTNSTNYLMIYDGVQLLL